MANKIELASEATCFGLCSSKQIVIEGLFITTVTKGCCETVENVIPIATVDDITLVNPTKLSYCFKCCTCGTTCRNGALVLCDCSCSDAVFYVNYSTNKKIAIEKVEDPKMIFEQLKQRLHVAKGGPVKQHM